MMTDLDGREAGMEERVGKFMVVLGAVLTGLTLLVVFLGWLMR
ncbi:MAG: hypothetical protein AB1899_07400 [Pseudomonadota bacterium]